MKHYLQKLSPREIGLLVASLCALVLAGLYNFAYLPLIEGQEKLAIAINNQQQVQTYLTSISAEASKLRQNPQVAGNTGGQSAMAIIDASSEPMQVKTCIQRVAPEGSNTTQIWLEKCSFDKLIDWLAVLQAQHGLTVKQIQLTKETENAGMVKGKFLLSE